MKNLNSRQKFQIAMELLIDGTITQEEFFQIMSGEDSEQIKMIKEMMGVKDE